MDDVDIFELDKEPQRDVEDLFKYKPDQQYDKDDPFANVPVSEFDESVYHQQIKEALECSKESEIVLGPDDYTEDTSCYESDQPVVPAVSGKKNRPLLKHKVSTGSWTELSGSRNDPPSQPVKLKPGNAYELAQELIKRVDFIIVCSAIYMFNGIVYELLDNETLDRLILKELREPIAEIGRPEIISAIRAFVKKEPNLVIDDPTIDPNYIVFRNGRLDIRTMEFSDNDPLVFQTSYLNFNYDRYNTHCPNFEKYLESVSGGDPDINELYATDARVHRKLLHGRQVLLPVHRRRGHRQITDARAGYYVFPERLCIDHRAAGARRQIFNRKSRKCAP